MCFCVLHIYIHNNVSIDTYAEAVDRLENLNFKHFVYTSDSGMSDASKSKAISKLFKSIDFDKQKIVEGILGSILENIASSQPMEVDEDEDLIAGPSSAFSLDEIGFKRDQDILLGDNETMRLY